MSTEHATEADVREVYRRAREMARQLTDAGRMHLTPRDFRFCPPGCCPAVKPRSNDNG